MGKTGIYSLVLVFFSIIMFCSSCAKDDNLEDDFKQNSNLGLTLRSEGEGGELTYTILWSKT